jgi:hypothetical protein
MRIYYATTFSATQARKTQKSQGQYGVHGERGAGLIGIPLAVTSSRRGSAIPAELLQELFKSCAVADGLRNRSHTNDQVLQQGELMR